MSPLVLEAPPRAARRRPGDRLPPPPPAEGGGDDGREPAPWRPRLDNTRLAMLFFLSAETMFFAGLISAFFVLRLSAAVWPPPLQPRLPVLVTGLNTLILLASSVAMIAALRAVRGDDRRALVERLAAAAALGALFLAVQGYEWARLIHYGLTVTSGAYGATFYTLIGTHAVHVLGALLWLGATLVLAARGRFVDGRLSGLRACATYWHYVVGLWPILYVTVYLL
ncbi:MAG: heme-copper oxidase subunit III [Candidatus Rokuibacteriota bacterium]|nr:MAG: heme-copper oxidase subunit III [Candidatus Rokubacteria bacterium]